MSGTSVALTGLNETVKTLRELGPKITDRVVRGAMNVSATPLVKSIRKRTKEILKRAEAKGYRRKEGKHLWQSIGKRVKKYKKGGVIFVAVGPLWQQGGYHGHLVELGHRISRKKLARIEKGKEEDRIAGGVGRTKALHFEKRAWDETSRQTLGIVESELKARLEKEAEKIAKENGVK